MSTCNRLDLQTLGSQPVIMPQNLPDHCLELLDDGRKIPKSQGRGWRFDSRLRKLLST